jgi:hypothetical protein
MKRLVISFAVAAALAVAMPAAGLAKHHHNSGHHKHGKGHHARLLRFGSLSSAPTGTSGPSGNDTAGTVDSFNSSTDMLTIKLNDASGSTITGKVTSGTEIECEAPEGTSGPTGATGNDDANEGPEQDRAQGSTTTTPTAHESDDNARGDDNEQGDDNEDQQSSSSPCGTAALTPGTVVKEAELEVGSGGAVFHSIDLIK